MNQPAVLSPVPDSDLSEALVVVSTHKPRGAVQRIAIRSGATVGRSPSSDVVLSDAQISRRHLQISREGEAWGCADLGSSNGTFVNGRPIGRERQVLRDGDRIAVGGTRLAFFLGPKRGERADEALRLLGGGGRQRSLAEGGLRAKVLSTEAMGQGTVTWIALGPTHVDVVHAERADALRMDESGIVHGIDLENLTESPVVVPANLVLRGGKQTRAVERTVVIPAGARVRIPVRCVEQGRWRAEDAGAGPGFVSAGSTNVGLRRQLSEIKSVSFRTNGAYAAEQDAVWREVDRELTRSGVESATRSYSAYVGEVRGVREDEVRRHGYTRPTEANAALLVSTEGWFALEGHASGAALEAAAPALLADLFGPPRQVHTAPSVESVLEKILAAPLRAIPCADGTIGAPFAAVGETLGGEVMLLDGALAYAGLTGEW